MEHRTCVTCRETLPDDAFYSRSRNTCKGCRKKAVAARREKLKSEGRCIECRSPLKGGGTLCLGCKKIHLDRHHANKERYGATSKKRRRELKLAALMAYGGPSCACCKEEHLEFLTIDHIEKNGAEHRREMLKEKGWKGDERGMSGSHTYLWLKQNNYPPGFRVLCFNCNFSLGHFGYCPHGGIVGAQQTALVTP